MYMSNEKEVLQAPLFYGFCCGGGEGAAGNELTFLKICKDDGGVRCEKSAGLSVSKRFDEAYSSEGVCH
ncbi:hypothetical protein [Brevibacillus dissolubilis]|uniref:hypothetical protein n=1 Tax=Brevibacillus dissolubilis TaxID=1844116 RepID=UPI001116CB61|nr:hypothetical protein [Brevibacillus dissolubilis]